MSIVSKVRHTRSWLITVVIITVVAASFAASVAFASTGASSVKSAPKSTSMYTYSTSAKTFFWTVYGGNKVRTAGCESKAIFESLMGQKWYQSRFSSLFNKHGIPSWVLPAAIKQSKEKHVFPGEVARGQLILAMFSGRGKSAEEAGPVQYMGKRKHVPDYYVVASKSSTVTINGMQYKRVDSYRVGSFRACANGGVYLFKSKLTPIPPVVSPTPTPSPTPTCTTTPTPTPTPTVTPTPTPTPTCTPTPTPTPTCTHTPCPSPSPTCTHHPCPSPSPTCTHTPCPTPSPSDSCSGHHHHGGGGGCSVTISYSGGNC